MKIPVIQRSYIRKINQFTLIAFLLAFVHLNSKAEQRTLEQMEDSLLNVLNNTPRDTTYLEQITTLEMLLLQTPKLLYYAEMKEKEARRQNRMDYVCQSMSDRAIYYSNQGNADSFLYWKNKMEPLAFELKEYNYIYFLKRIEVSLLVKNNKIQEAIQTAQKMYEEAKEQGITEGIVASCVSIGWALQNAKQPEAAIKSYEEGIALMSESNSRWTAWKMSSYKCLLILYLDASQYEKGLECAEQMERFIDSLQKSQTGTTQRSLFTDEWLTVFSQKTELYLKLGDIKNATTCLEEARKYYPEASQRGQVGFHQTSAVYYYETGSYSKALEELNQAYDYTLQVDLNRASKVMEFKADLLNRLNRNDESVRLYKQTLQLTDSLNNEWLGSQLNELRTVYDTDYLTMKNQKLELDSKQAQLQIMLVSISLMGFVLLVTIILYIRSSRLKKKLEESERQLILEKDLLQKSERELRIAKEKAEEARDLALKAEHKQSYLANMSHEIRTPLNAIVGFSNLLVSDEELEPEERQMFIDTINQNCDHLLKLIGNVLDLSRMESGKMSFSIAPHSLTATINELYSTHSMMMPEHVKLLKEIPSDDITITTDKFRLKQVITNFVNNAVKFTTSGHIKIGYKLNPEQNKVIIFAEDTGKGIPPESQKKIFERFFKQDDSDQGTGLGLSICMLIAEKLNGEITLHSEEGKGSYFAIVLPL